MTLSFGGGNADDPVNVSSAIQIVVLMTILTLAPSLLMLMTSFTRIVVVLGFIRGAIGLQGAPSNQILLGVSMFLDRGGACVCIKRTTDGISDGIFDLHPVSRD